MPEESYVDDAHALLRQGDAMAAFRLLRPNLIFGQPLSERRDALALFASVAGAIAGPELQQKLEAAAGLEDVQALYDAGYALYEEQLYGIAAALLDHANSEAPGHAVLVIELVANLEMLLEHRTAVDRLQASGLVPSNGQICYHLAFHQVMCGEMAEAGRTLGVLRALVGDDAQLTFMANALGAIVERHERLASVTALDARDLAGWHAVLHGAALLHESPFGHDTPMHGRYAYITDGYSLQKAGLLRLQTFLGALSIRPERVLLCEDRGSRILGRAAAELLGVPTAPLVEDADARGLVVAYDLDRLEHEGIRQHLLEHHPDQWLYVHACNWVRPPAYAPDFTSVLYQVVDVPWEAGRGPNGPREADPAPDEVLAARLLASDVDEEAHGARALDDVLRIGAALDPAAAWRRASGRRAHFRIGGPVPSSRFT